MSALGQLAGGIAHDFNNVLQAVQGGGTLVLRQADASAEVRRLAELVLRAVERGAAITHRLLAFSRRRDLCAQAIDPGELLRSLREILVPTLGVGVEIRLAVPGEVPLLLADKGQLETVLVNLATNARDAMAGQGVLTIAAVAQAWGNDALADAPQLRPGRYVCLSVTDTGAGMDAATLARVTEPFFTTKPKGEGTGLGLAMAQDFAEQSGGGLHIRSALNEGTIVTLYLPVAPEAPGAPADP
jgi:signal transduction histidine kinase